MINRWLITLICLSGVALSAAAETPAAPDYADPNTWAAYPGKPGPEEDTPEGIAKTPFTERNGVDVFFIHPTTYLSLSIGNARYDESGATRTRLENGVLRFQASVFNHCCRIFVPRYRQASLKGITAASPAGFASADLAYSDVRRAFDYYLSKENNGRPFIIAGHSQGSIHAIRLLQERIIGTPLSHRLIAAYVPGSALPHEIEEKGLAVCRTPDMTACILDWNSDSPTVVDKRRKESAVIWWQGRYQAIAGRPLVCVNPLNWIDNGAAAATENLGAVYFGGRGQPIPAPITGAAGAACDGGLLRVQIREGQRRHFTDPLSLFGIYHDFDYGLWYMNIRQNLDVRIHAEKSEGFFVEHAARVRYASAATLRGCCSAAGRPELPVRAFATFVANPLWQFALECGHAENPGDLPFECASTSGSAASLLF